MKHLRNLESYLGMPLKAVALLSAALVCTPLLATERVILGNTRAASLYSSQDPDVSAVISGLKNKLKVTGTVRVIVGILY